jgi:hypothetical protein
MGLACNIIASKRRQWVEKPQQVNIHAISRLRPFFAKRLLEWLQPATAV